MSIPRPSGPRPVAPGVRPATHMAGRRELKKPAQAGRDHTRNWPAWTDDVAVRDALPPIESAIVDTLGRLGRAATGNELAFQCPAIRKAGLKARDRALESLRDRGLVGRREVREASGGRDWRRTITFVKWGFPEHFEPEAG